MRPLTPIALFLTAAPSIAQLAESGAPSPLVDGLELEGIPSLDVPPPDVASYLAEDELGPVWPLRYGALVPVEIDAARHGAWTTSETGALVWRVEVHSAGARSIGFEFESFVLPSGGQLFAYDGDLTEIHGAYGASNNQPNGELQLSPYPGDRVVLEYRQEAWVEGRPELEIDTLIYDYRGLFDLEASLADGSYSGSCTQDANCPEGDSFGVQKRAGMRTLSGGGLCSGALINNTAQDGTAYVLTAWHCGQGSNTIFRFNYANPTCGGGGAPTSFEVAGATVLASDQPSDGRLMRINNPIPDAFNPYFAGWNRNLSSPTLAYTLGHPGGQPQKLSISSNGASTAFSTIGGIGTIPSWSVGFDFGAIQGGSSGGPLYDQSGRIRGFASGAPNVSCPTSASFGRLSAFWNNTDIAQFLDPLDLGLNALTGFDPFDPDGPIPPGAFEATGATPATLAAVLDTQPFPLTIEGVGFEGLSGVRVNGEALGVLPPEFFVVNDSEVRVLLTTPLEVGLLDVELIKGGAVELVQVPVGVNETLTLDLLNSDPSFLISAAPVELYIGGPPGDIAALLLSTSNQATSLPGIVDLALGNDGLSLIELGGFVIPPSGVVELIGSVGSPAPGTKLFFQAAWIQLAEPTFPLSVSNVESGTFIF